MKEARELANKSWRKRCLDRKTNVTDTEEGVCLKESNEASIARAEQAKRVKER